MDWKKSAEMYSAEATGQGGGWKMSCPVGLDYRHLAMRQLNQVATPKVHNTLKSVPVFNRQHHHFGHNPFLQNHLKPPCP